MRHSPEELAKIMEDALEGRAVSLGFTPALSRMQGVNYRYEVGSASIWAKRFYTATEPGRRLLADELKRYEVGSEYRDFVTQTFHVGPDLSIWPTAYTLFGDVILDERNGGKPLGNLSTSSLNEILSGKHALRNAAMAEAWMYRGDFKCSDCKHFSNCNFHGVGAVRRVYSDYESRTGSCHGPVSFLNETSGGLNV